MNRLIAALCLLFPLITTAQDTDTLPPLIDRALFFDDPEIAGAQLSPDGQFLSFIKPYNDVRNIWVKPASAPFEDAVPVTADTTRPIPGYFWSRDGRYILYVQDKGGDENFHVYAVDPSEAADGPPEARNLTDADGARALLLSVPKAMPNTLFVGLNDRDPAWHDVYSVDLTTGERTLLRENTDNISGWRFDLDGNLRLATRTAGDGSTEILRVDDDAFTLIYSCSVFETCGPSRFLPGGEQVYLQTNKGDDTDLIRLAKLDLATGETTLVESDPENQVDFGGVMISDVDESMIATFYNGDRLRIYFKNADYEADYNLIKSKLGDVDLNFGSSTDDERLWLISANSDTDPGATYLFDRETKDLTFQYRPRPQLPTEHLAEMKPVRYTSVDGLEIPAYLTLPKGVAAENLPAIIFPHGGPWARDSWGYDGFAQFLANRGYAVLQPNFRGSTGYGKAFLNAGNKEWGDLMQDDLTAGAEWLVEQGIADGERIGIMGGSYGGYATLAGLAFTPDVYAAGVSIVGPSNLMTLLESIPPYWESFRNVFYERMGDPRTPEGEAELKRQSPLYSAEKITAPLLVIQGANDPRVKQAESDQIVVAMRDLNRPVAYIVADDEGHGFRRPVNNMAAMAASEAFLAEHLGGRFQEDMPDDVAARLEELKVDPASVELPEALGTGLETAPLPTPEATPTAGTFAYAMNIDLNGQTMTMDVQRSVVENGETWIITDNVTTPMGQVVDEAVVAKGTMAPVTRMVSQGPMLIELEYTPNAVSGTMTMNGNANPIDAMLEAPVFGDGASIDATLATLPLAEGYETSYRVFDAQQQKVRIFGVKVVGIESVTVPAGTYDAFHLEVTPADGDPARGVWVSVEGRHVVKTTATLPQMGGAKVVSELAEVSM